MTRICKASQKLAMQEIGRGLLLYFLHCYFCDALHNILFIYPDPLMFYIPLLSKLRCFMH